MAPARIPIALYDAPASRELDRVATAESGLSELTLMKRAGEAAHAQLIRHWRAADDVVIACGSGNNAGDGYVLARLLSQAGTPVRVIQVGDTAALSNHARACLEDMLGCGLDTATSVEAIDNAGLVVDALLGTGVSRPLDEAYREVVERINQSSAPVLSIDIPSGLDAGAGKIFGAAVFADVTVTFIGAKQGLFTGAGPDHTGWLEFDDLGVPAQTYQSVAPTARRLDMSVVAPLLPRRARTGHKGTHGHALIIGGSAGFLGAAYLAGEAAGRSGAGLITLAIDTAAPLAVNAVRPELMVHAVDDISKLEALIEPASAIAIGPGLGFSDRSMSRLARILETNQPLVIDADALKLLAAEPIRRDNWVLTPHPGEAASMLDCSTAEVQRDRFAAAREIQQCYGGVVILKGAGSVVTGGSEVEIVTDGNPGMGSGGMGDVLTGVVVGLLVQGYSCLDAARIGATVHAAAGDRAAEHGERGLLARDLMAHIRRLVN